MTHPTQGAAPTIDPTAEILEPTMTGTGLEAEIPMPTVENEQPFMFRPGNGITTMDVIEIAMMQIIQIFGGPQVEPGALRAQPMQALRYAQLSPEAQRWMAPVKLPVPAPK